MDYSKYFWEFYYFVLDIAKNVLTQFVPLLFEPINQLKDIVLKSELSKTILGWLFDLVSATPFGELTPATLFAGSMLTFVIARSILSFIKP